MNLNHLPIFIDIYRSKSITAAARKMGVSKSAVSQSLAALELELRNSLFIREGRQLLPTRFGEILFEKIEPLLQAIDMNVKVVSESGDVPIGLISIGVPADVGANFIFPILGEFSKGHPGFQFKVVSGIPEVLCGLLVENKLDFVLIDAGDVFSKNFPISHRLLVSENQVLACSSEYAKSFDKLDFSFEQMIQHDFISHVPQATEIKFWFKHHYRRVPQGNMRVKVVIDNINSLKSAIVEGFGFGLIPKRLIAHEIKAQKVMLVPESKGTYKNRIHLCQLPGKKPSKIEKNLVARIEAAFTGKNNNEI